MKGKGRDAMGAILKETKMSAILTQPDPITVTKIPGYMPDNFPSRLFKGGRGFLAMNTVYSLMDRFAPEYNGGVWSAFEASNGALFTAPDNPGTTPCSWSMNGFSGELSWEAAGIFTTAVALCLEWERSQSDLLAEAHIRVMDMARDHPEAPLLIRALD
jgi:hypothetical protein